MGSRNYLTQFLTNIGSMAYSTTGNMQLGAITGGHFHISTFGHISAKNHCLIVVEGSLEAHRWAYSNDGKKIEIFQFQGTGPELPFLGTGGSNHIFGGYPGVDKMGYFSTVRTGSLVCFHLRQWFLAETCPNIQKWKLPPAVCWIGL